MLDRDLLSGLMIQVDISIVLLFQQFVSGLILLYIVVRNDRLSSFSRWLRAALDCRCPWRLHDRARTIPFSSPRKRELPQRHLSQKEPQ
jgi:hypothetical protein